MNTINKILLILIIFNIIFNTLVHYRNNVILVDIGRKCKGYHRRLIKMLEIIIPIMNRYNIVYWISCGTLLGYARYNKSFIPWDDDIDLCILHDENLNNNLKLFDTELKENGMFLKKTPFGYAVNNKDLTKNKNKAYIDLFIYKKENNKYIANNWARKLWPNEYFYENELFPLRQDYFKNVLVNIPKEHVKFLKKAYGKECLDKYILTGFHHCDIINRMIILLTRHIPIIPDRS